MYYKSKYHAIKTYANGIKFDSKKEATRYNELRLLEKVGAISNLKLQVPYVLIDKSVYGRQIVYKADFVYYDNEIKKEIVEDSKGMKTPVYRLKKRMLAERYGIIIKES